MKTQPNMPVFQAKGINKFVPHQSLKKVTLVQRKWKRRFDFLNNILNKTSDAETRMKIMMKMKECEEQLQVFIPNRNQFMLQQNDPRKSLPKKKQRELGLL